MSDLRSAVFRSFTVSLFWHHVYGVFQATTGHYYTSIILLNHHYAVPLLTEVLMNIDPQNDIASHTWYPVQGLVRLCFTNSPPACDAGSHEARPPTNNLKGKTN